MFEVTLHRRAARYFQRLDAKLQGQLRTKFEAARASITTAAQFIEHVASTSSFTGKEYTMRFADGRISISLSPACWLLSPHDVVSHKLTSKFQMRWWPIPNPISP